MNIAVLASTKGTDLQAILDDGLPVKVVISNKECYALKRAEKYNIPSHIITIQNREEHDKKIDEYLQHYKIDLIVLVGYMRLFSPWFVRKYKNKIMNIHPSLLPSFPGMDRSVHKEVLEYGCKVSGCTIHFVSEGMDDGPIIMQEAVYVSDDETVDSLKEKVQAKEKELYPKAIRLFPYLRVDGRKVKKNGL